MPILISCETVSTRITSDKAAKLVSKGVESTGWSVDLLPLSLADSSDYDRQRLEKILLEKNFQQRMLAARALLIVTKEIYRATLIQCFAGDLATRARQSGVPCYLVVQKHDLTTFEQRMLDLQAVIEIKTPASLTDAGAVVGHSILKRELD